MAGILFLEDWAKYPNAVLDTMTSNKSWIELALKFKKMGYKNHAFFLALHNPLLLGVDPHSPDLTPQQMTMIAIECSQNFWYVARNVLRAPSNTGVGSSPITLNRANLSFWWSFFNHIQYILVIPRQCGKSFASDTLDVAMLNFICKSTQINLLTKDDVLRQQNIERIRKIYAELPPYLNFRSRNDSNNTENFTVTRNGNIYLAHVPRASERDAYKLGRGLTSPIMKIDEGPFQPNINIAAGSAIAAMGAVFEQAKAKGEPYGVAWTTTAGKQDDPSGAYVYKLATDSAPWTEHFYDCKNQEALYAMVRSHAKVGDSGQGVLRIYGCFSHRQCGKTDEWLLQMLEESNQSPDDANRDYFCVWTAGGANSPFTIEQLTLLKRSGKDTVYDQIWTPYNYVIQWFVPEEQLSKYIGDRSVILGMDTSNASGKDEITLVFRDAETGLVFGVGAFNETNLNHFVKFLFDLLMRYPTVTLVPERQSSAVTMIDYLIDHMVQRSIDPFKRIFNWVVSEPMEHKQFYEQYCMPMSRRDPYVYVKAKSLFGYATAGSGKAARSNLYSDAMTHAVKYFGGMMSDRRLIQQFLGLTIRNGRLDHAEGGHDDLVIAYLLTHWFLLRSKNLKEYGIDPLKVLRIQTVEDQKVMTPAEIWKNQEQVILRSQIEEVTESLKKQTDEFVIGRLEAKLRSMYSRLVLREQEQFSIDAVLQQLKQERRLNRLLKR